MDHINYYKKYEPIFGNWYIKRIIGEGSFGRVFEIERHDLGATYRAALKIITVPQSQSEVKSVMAEGMSIEEVTEYYKNIVLDIVKESELMSRLKGNTNIVSYEDHLLYEHSDGIGWDILIKMELLTPFLEHMSKNSITAKDVTRLGIDICKALVLCENNQIIHRDIKPENIFVTDNGDYKLGDFGVARTLEKTSGGLSKKGTYTYMAPEIYRGEAYGPNVDIYSLGIVMYWLLNKRRTPFLPAYPNPISYNDRESALLKRIGGETIPRPLLGDDDLANIVLKACEFNPQERYHSANEMLIDLERVYKKQDNVIVFDIDQHKRQKEKVSKNKEENATELVTDDNETALLDGPNKDTTSILANDNETAILDVSSKDVTSRVASGNETVLLANTNQDSASTSSKGSVIKENARSIANSITMTIGNRLPKRLLAICIAFVVLIVAVLLFKGVTGVRGLDKETAAAYEKLLVEEFYENDYKGVMYNQGLPQYIQADLSLGSVWMQTALCDITGDGKSELLYGRHVYTCEDGVAKDITGEIYSHDSQYLSDGLCATTNNATDSDGITILGAIEYASINHNALYRLEYYEEDTSAFDLYRFELGSSGQLIKTMKLTKVMNVDNSAMVYMMDGNEINKSEFVSRFDSAAKDFGETINYSIRNHESLNNPSINDTLKQLEILDMFKELENASVLAKPYSEMVEYLRTVSKVHTPENNEDKGIIHNLDGLWGKEGKNQSTIYIHQGRTAEMNYNTDAEVPCWWDLDDSFEVSIYDMDSKRIITLMWNNEGKTLIDSKTGDVYYKADEYGHFSNDAQEVYLSGVEVSVLDFDDLYKDIDNGVEGKRRPGDTIWCKVNVKKSCFMQFAASDLLDNPAIENVYLCNADKQRIDSINFSSSTAEVTNDEDNTTKTETIYDTNSIKVQRGESYYIVVELSDAASSHSSVGIWTTIT